MSQKRQPCELYRPPHLRNQCVHTELGNDTSNSMDDYLEVKNYFFQYYKNEIHTTIRV